MAKVICPYCHKEAELVQGDTIYPHRQDLHRKHFYLCSECDAYCGCHGDSLKPLGRLANKTLRAAKSMAHRQFDVLWVDGHMSRSEAYAWLAKELDIEPRMCHIGLMNVQMCHQVVEVVSNYFQKGKSLI